MKLAVSSYNKDIPSLTMFQINLEKKTYSILDEKMLNAPSFLIENDGYIYTYSKEQICLLSYKIIDNKLIEIDKLLLPGVTLTHLVFSKKHNRLYAASYADGSYLMVDVNKGKFSNLKYIYPEIRPSKCHCVFLNKNEDIVNIIDIEQDLIYQCDKDLNLLNKIKLPEKSGPRHGLYHNGFIYVVTEYSNEVFVLDSKGNLLQQISTIGEYKDETYGATLLICNDKLYASNRGLETIAVFDIKDNNLLNFKEMINVYGKHSRHMIKTNDEKYIATFNKNSHNIVFININTKQNVLEIPYMNVSCGVEITI